MEDPLIGQQFANYRIERLLGQGGMATVYFGQDVKLHRPVAIKFIDRRYKNNPVYASRFVNEARMMAGWHHENIIPIYYADDAQGYSYYAMEYVDGQDLDRVMSLYEEEGELMPMADVLRFGNAIASALDYAHSQGVIHRDIKPSNILIAKDGRVMLGDFGLALDQRDGSMGSIFGTPHYISPEQARRSADAVPQSDLYSLGIILYEILTGSVPFNDPSPASIALQHISEPPPPPRTINPEISPAVETVILKALDKDPKNRYQTGVKLMSALEDAVHPKGAAQKMSLPPLPVGVPTIHGSNKSLEQIAKRATSKANASQNDQPVVAWPDTVKAAAQPRRKNAWYLILAFLIMGIGGWYFTNSGSWPIAFFPAPTFASPLPASTDTPASPTQVLIPPLAASTNVQATNTLNPPTATFESSPTSTSSSATQASVQTAAPSAVAFPTLKYPDGYHFSLFWNETSFYMLNSSKVRRTLSAFSFERLDETGLPMDIFVGYHWETKRIDYLPAKLCVGITLYGNQEPAYLNPPECVDGYLSTYQPLKDNASGMVFWNEQEGSTQFRVLWLGEEVARCEISAGICDVYVPQ